MDHVEYRDRLRLYEEIHSPAGAPAQMHGLAVVWLKALETGRVIRVRKGEVECELGTVADPVALLEALAHRG